MCDIISHHFREKKTAHGLKVADPGGRARSMVWVSDRSLAGIVGSYPAGGMDVCLLRVLCVVR